MKRLIEKGLMFGNLVHIRTPVLVDRYNRALRQLTGRETALDDFHVDISGFSPEIGDEFGDPLYLNQNGCNRQFILLVPDQVRAPLLNAKFSTSRDILQRFMSANAAQIFALTAHEAIAGELLNSVYSVADPAALFEIRKIRIEADTPEGRLRSARDLADRVDRFLSEEDAWFDDLLIAEMIGLGKRTGNITRNPIRLVRTEAEQRNFWTAHFGGLYIFRDLAHPAAICSGDARALGPLPIARAFSLEDRNQIARFLDLNGLAEPVVTARDADGAAILRQKMDFIVVDMAAGAGIDLTGATRRDLRAIARRHAADLPEEFHALRRLVAWAEDDAPWPTITSDHPAYFYTLRAAPGPDRDLVNMLLAELSQKDFRQLFICHKEAFYAAYRTWPETRRAYAADFLAREYMADKSGARAALFGSDATLTPAAPPPSPRPARAGPWGTRKEG